jgi:small subunit ribosomal protein S4e
MTNHQKRLSAPNSWPVERKTEKFTVKADDGPHGDAGVPLVVLLRDVLGYADSKKEVRYALESGNVRINGDKIRDYRRPVGMFDILEFSEREEYYRVFPDEGGRLALTEIDADAAGSKLGKIVGKRQVAGGETQINLHDGQNVLVEDASDYSGDDSLVVDNETDEIVAHFPYVEGALVTAVSGQHAGEIGEVETIEVTPGSGDNRVVVEGVAGSDDFETIEEYVVVIDENFIEGEVQSTSESSSGDEPRDGGLEDDAEESSDEDEVSDDE